MEPKKDTLCWDCQRACGGCSWSQSFTPVDGWEAQPTKIKCGRRGFISSYLVTACPLFIPDKAELTVADKAGLTIAEAANILGVKVDTMRAWRARGILSRKLEEHGRLDLLEKLKVMRNYTNPPTL